LAGYNTMQYDSLIIW